MFVLTVLENFKEAGINYQETRSKLTNKQVNQLK